MIKASYIINSYYSLGLVTHSCKSSENSFPVSSLLPFLKTHRCEQAAGQCTVLGVHRWIPEAAISRNPMTLPSCHHSSVALINMMRFPPGSCLRWIHISSPEWSHAECQSRSFHPLDWKSIYHMTGVTFRSCDRYCMFMENSIIVFLKCLHNKLCGLPCPESLRKWTFCALWHAQIAIKCFVYSKSQTISHFHQIHVLSYHLASAPV